MASEASQSISLKILVEKEKNRVVFAEANKDFVDVIFSFLTMPIGTIVSLIREHLLKGEIGCLNNLYESVEKLDEEYLASEHKEILLHPRSATEVYFRNLKLNLIENNNSKCYLCRYADCTFLSYYQIYSCRCGQALEHFVYLSDAILPDGGMFVKPTARFIVADDLRVLPMSTKTALSLLKEFGAMYGSKIEERSLNIGKDEILKLLKYSLASMTPLSDTIMEPFIGKTSNTHCVKHGPSTRQFPCVDDIIDNPQINLKLVVNKYDNKAVYYAEVGEDFVSVLCSFLAFPIGHVFKEFSSLSFKGCLGNLYRSIQNSDLDKLFKSEEMKSVLLDPKLAPGLAGGCKLFGIEEAAKPSYSTLSSMFNKRYINSNPKSIGDFKIGDGLVTGPSMFMVTDNLSITPLSTISGLSLINNLKVPVSDVQELKVTMGEEEALRLLVAALISKSALTDAFMPKEQKEEP
ncbi:Rho1 guanine nucleotide exchange factor like [Actinidia chinensis var. chinensis]|uniref:Rho1 guanine nucleotide exchange factor like n=1 Tax=Actinidia chinensis var. chinensis TaxID=1590841 RepID=A0A2R6Q6K5_ACTCC|nr:Rho1 guanine nucleotide exchange factor like [Actinidia chinensis var. chinensis]